MLGEEIKYAFLQAFGGEEEPEASLVVDEVDDDDDDDDDKDEDEKEDEEDDTDEIVN